MTGVDTGRAAILREARRAFARNPYATVTLRGIAAQAGVSASLIVKHFGGKKSLFDVVADFTEAADLLLDAPNDRLGEHAVLTLIRSRRDNDMDLLLRVVFAAGGDDERSLLRQRFRTQVTQRIAARLDGPDVPLRAELIVAQLLGLGAVMAIGKDEPPVAQSPQHIARWYAPGLQALIDG
jgi:AcrR family transcriptional regulator